MSKQLEEALQIKAKKDKGEEINWIEEDILKNAYETGLLEEVSEEIETSVEEPQEGQSGFELSAAQFLGLFLNWAENRDYLNSEGLDSLKEALIKLAYDANSGIVVYTKDTEMAQQLIDLMDNEELETSIEMIQP